MAKIKLKGTGEIVEAILDKNNEMACFLNIDTDDFETITDFELVEEDEETTDQEEYSSSSSTYTEEQAPVLTLANVLGGKLKSLTVEFK